MNRLADPNFWTDLNAAFIIFKYDHPDLEYTVIEQKEYGTISIELADWKQYLFAHMDIRPSTVPKDHEVALDFWKQVIFELYSKIEKLQKDFGDLAK